MTTLPTKMYDLPIASNTLPAVPGVYLFRDAHDQIIYIGKAKNIRARLGSYFHKSNLYDARVATIVEAATSVEVIQAESELAAMLLEAQLIQAHQPRCNVIFKTGQPFLYIMVTQGQLPELKIVRHKKQKGVYFGPFIEKGTTRKVFDFLVKTFRLRLCGRKMPGGCLYYHMGLCAGQCRSDFDREAYRNRLELAIKVLKKGKKDFMSYVQDEIKKSNEQLTFERSRELHEYYQAFERTFDALDATGAQTQRVAEQDIWVISCARDALFLFRGSQGVVHKKESMYFPLKPLTDEELFEHLLSYYRVMVPAGTILFNFSVSDENKTLLEQFLTAWHHLSRSVIVAAPEQELFHQLIRFSVVAMEQELQKKKTVAQELKRLLKLSIAPRVIDCFDVSHKQGMFLVGSCVRFVDGVPAKEYFRHFNIKTVIGQDDYASLRELVERRYRDGKDLPDLVLIDGGKGQRNAVKNLLPHTDCISLAKREERVFSDQFPEGKVLSLTTYSGQLLIALRDYAHHFAVSFHRKQAATTIHQKDT